MLRTLAPILKEGDGGLPFHTQLKDVFFWSKQWVSGEELLKLTKSIKSMAAKSSVSQLLTSLEFFVTVKVDVSSVSKSCVQ